jgi:4-amino-4-deoxy-L-arabinose transferase-like glycosyltransferase
VPIRRTRAYLFLCSVATLIAAGLVWYSQTMSFAWDEGFHLLCAQLISFGRRPYVDFAFCQTPLNSYWNALWLTLFGQTWRPPHAAAALCTAGAVLLIADYLFERFPAPRWRLAAALVAAALFGLNIQVVDFGTLGQAYGLCLFLSVAAFRFSVASVDRPGLGLPAAAGLASGGAACASLLCAPVAPVLLLWMLVLNRAGRRLVKAVAFVAAVVVSFLPVLILYVQSPRNVLFGVLQYNLLFRSVQWEGSWRQNFEVYFSWIDSSNALLLMLLSVAGVLFVAFRCDWERRLRSEFYLCGLLAAALCIHISTARPTFSRYYLLAVPFLALLAAAGFYWLATRLWYPDRPLWPTLALVLLAALMAGKSLYEGRDDFTWHIFDALSRKVVEVTPPGALLRADEQIYFLSQHRPPSGMELADSHKLEFPPALNAQLHLISGSELERRTKAGYFDTFQTCDDESDFESLDLGHLYAHKAKIESCTVFWGPNRAPAAAH